MDLDTGHLRALVAVVDEGNIPDAAIALGTSQASVSRSVQHLETDLGQQLLSRSSRHVEATPIGEQVVVHARRIIETLTQIEAEVARTGEDLLVGYAWAALGERTLVVQRGWDATEQGDLVFVQSNTPTAGLLEGRCEVSVVRRPVADPRLDSALVGTERRYAVLATDHPLAARETVNLLDFAGQTVAVDLETGTTSGDLWQTDAPPAGFRMTHGVDEWLTLIASGRAVGVSSEATVAQHARPGVAYRLLGDAPPIPVWLAWWRQKPPTSLVALLDTCRSAYGG